MRVIAVKMTIFASKFCVVWALWTYVSRQSCVFYRKIKTTSMVINENKIIIKWEILSTLKAYIWSS